jgi:hypothetical protein
MRAQTTPAISKNRIAIAKNAKTLVREAIESGGRDSDVRTGFKNRHSKSTTTQLRKFIFHRGWHKIAVRVAHLDIWRPFRSH